MNQSNTQSDAAQRKRLIILSLSALGVVFGDIGTSPLYSIRQCFYGKEAIAVNPTNVLGVLSLIFWALFCMISIKYIVFVLRADNHGEGGIFALSSLLSLSQKIDRRWVWLVVLLGLFGGALLYADGMLTPAISVLSAVEGLQVATPVFEPYIIPITIAILILLFMFQSHGTARIGSVFGPITLLWFAIIALLGLVHIVRAPQVIAAVNPLYAVRYFMANGWRGFPILGAVFLVMTGGEALYADIGHFGVRPIRIAWFSLVLPALLLNYFGQGALLLRSAAAAVNPFFHMAPEWARYPLVFLATLATIIASQAIISGSFSMTRQAVQLGFCPRLEIRHTSAEEMGQIYIPAVNWTLMVACIALVLGFKSSNNLAGAYGVGIILTMLITTILFFFLLRYVWKWNWLPTILLAGFFLSIDLTFAAANMTKIIHGGWFPLLIASLVFTLMLTWRRGREIIVRRMKTRLQPLDQFVDQMKSHPPVRVPGTVVCMVGNPLSTPLALSQNLKHNKVLHEQILILTVIIEEIPTLPLSESLQIADLGAGFYRLSIHYGYMQDPNIPRELKQFEARGLKIDPDTTSYFLGREILMATGAPGMVRWREKLFIWMSHNAQNATSFFNLPPERVLDLGARLKL